jgi:hypothetical protein
MFLAIVLYILRISKPACTKKHVTLSGSVFKMMFRILNTLPEKAAYPIGDQNL